MEGTQTAFVWWLIGSVQLVGLSSAWLARMAEGSVRQTASQMFFLVCLAIVGMTTVVTVQFEIAGWFFSATTLALMVLAVTCDFGGIHAARPRHLPS